jgi:hypothetical protein
VYFLGDPPKTHTFVNNIIAQDDNTPIAFMASTGGITFSHNLWSRATIEEAEGDSDIVGDPMLVEGDTTAGNLDTAYFKLQATSPAIDKGTDIGQTYIGAAPDMGALEYDRPAGPVAPPQPRGSGNGIEDNLSGSWWGEHRHQISSGLLVLSLVAFVVIGGSSARTG